MATAGAPAPQRLKLQFSFTWKLVLDPARESEPLAHFYISTIYSKQVQVVKLERSSGSTDVYLDLPFDRATKRRISPEELTKSCRLNVDFYVHTANNDEECVSNPAGCVMVPLFELLTSPGGVVNSPVYLYMVHHRDRSVKGAVTIAPLAPLPGLTRPPVMVSFDGALLPTPSRELVQACVERLKRNNYIALRCIDACDEIYGAETGFEPTMPTVKRINSSIWTSRAGSISPMFYTVDLVDPEIDARYFVNAAEIVRRRMRLRVSDLMRLDMKQPSAAELRTFGSFVGQFMCLYVVHCTYRSDFIHAYDSRLKTFVMVMTENFGDVSVDKGAGDCEDFAKIIIRLYLSLRRLRVRKQLGEHPLLEKIAEFLACFVPFLVLYGVSSAQINDPAKNVKKMGAHENAILAPLHQVLGEIAHFDPEIYDWVKEVRAVEPNIDEYIERSKRYQSLILEGTGVLEAVPDVERNVRLRVSIEDAMDEAAFTALRRTFYYTEGDSSFYKTVDKLFTPLFLLTGARFGSFIVLQERAEERGKPKDAVPLRKRYTKSASFSLFVKNDPRVAMIMEPPFEAEELRVAQSVMKDVHPPEPIRAPPRHFAKRDACDAHLLAAFGPSGAQPTPQRPYAWEYRAEALASPEDVDPPSRYTEQAYFLRSGVVYPERLASLHRLFSSLARAGTLKNVVCYPEWPDEVVGGYRIVLEMATASTGQK